MKKNYRRVFILHTYIYNIYGKFLSAQLVHFIKHLYFLTSIIIFTLFYVQEGKKIKYDPKNNMRNIILFLQYSLIWAIDVSTSNDTEVKKHPISIDDFNHLRWVTSPISEPVSFSSRVRRQITGKKKCPKKIGPVHTLNIYYLSNTGNFLEYFTHHSI